MSKAKIAATPHLWHVVDARNQVVGRLAPQIAKLLMGKHKPTFVPHVDGGDFVVVVNAKDVAFTGKKATEKLYRWHTGWMGGLKTLTARQMMERNPAKVIELAVKGMMPKNAIREARMRRLRVFADESHPHAVQTEQSAAYAPEFLQATQPLDMLPRPKADTGAFVKNAEDLLSAEEIASIQWTKLTHDEDTARRYQEFQTRQATRRAKYKAAMDARILARAAQLDAEDAARRKASEGAQGGVASPSSSPEMR